MGTKWLLLINSVLFLIRYSVSQTPGPVSCSDFGSCETCINAPISCLYCPTGNGCIETDESGTCTNSLAGQLANDIGDCQCLAASSCQDMIDNNLWSGRGWCPYHSKCLQGGGTGPYDSIDCPVDASLGQWTTDSGDCLCLSATTCQDMTDNSLWSGRGWCPSIGKCYQGGGTGPYDDIDCPADASAGQWTTDIGDCLCLSATSCDYMTENGLFSSRGWCPSAGKCYQGSATQPADDIPCDPTIADGQWSTSSNDCKCLAASSCEDMYKDGSIWSARGWCPYHNKCFQGSATQPDDSPIITCPANAQVGQWSSSTEDCECLASTSCEDMVENNLFASRGWCPYYNKCYQGSSSLPYDDIDCIATEHAQWTSSTEDCECLSTTSCESMEENGLFAGSRGWCKSKKKCYLGNSVGPYGNVDCSEWISSSGNCNGDCPKNCKNGCNLVTNECTECQEGYEGKYCQYNVKYCEDCNSVVSKIISFGLGKMAGTGWDCYSSFWYTFGNCARSWFSLGPFGTAVACSTMGYVSYKFCDKLSGVPAEFACEALKFCKPDLINQLKSRRRRRSLSVNANEQYPYWPFEFYMSGIQYTNEINGNNDNQTVLYFDMAYSYVDNLMYTKMSNNYDIGQASINIIKDFTNYYMIKYDDIPNDNTCNYTDGATELTEPNYLETYLSSHGVDELMYNGTLLYNNELVSVWYSDICGSSNLTSTNFTMLNQTDLTATNCGIRYYYYDVNIMDEYNNTIYRKPIMSKVYIKDMEFEIITEFNTFMNYIPDNEIFNEAPDQCMPTYAPTEIPSKLPTQNPADIPTNMPTTNTPTSSPVLITTTVLEQQTTGFTNGGSDDTETTNTDGVILDGGPDKANKHLNVVIIITLTLFLVLFN